MALYILKDPSLQTNKEAGYQRRATVEVCRPGLLRQLTTPGREAVRPAPGGNSRRPELEAWLTQQMEQIAGEVRALAPPP